MTAFVGMKCRALTLGAGSDRWRFDAHRRKSARLVGNAVFRETNSSVAGVRQLGKPEVSGRRDAAEREHLHSGVSMAAARQRTTRAAKSPCYQVDSRGFHIAKCERCWPTA
jgi:hypothetical protein